MGYWVCLLAITYTVFSYSVYNTNCSSVTKQHQLGYENESFRPGFDVLMKSHDFGVGDERNDSYSRSLHWHEGRKSQSKVELLPRGQKNGKKKEILGTEVIDDEELLHDLDTAESEEVEETIDDLEPVITKNMAALLIAYKIKFLILVPMFVLSLVMLAGSTGFAGLFFLLFVGVAWYRNKKGDSFPFKHELFS